MTIESVRAFLAEHAPDAEIIDQGASTATVEEAAATLGVEPGRIAKTLSVRVGDRVVLVVARGDARLDNRKVKDALGGRPRMLGAEEVETLTGHPVGGVCPFGLATPLAVYCDHSLRDFDLVFPAAGSRTSSVRITPDRLAAVTGATWADLCRAPETVASN
ncbi:YbaK/EbsC family protein [Sphingomonas montanisoli]|uniref:YbaK/EbsC family protein n=1 Tax=Sphingomonas montanisoli TaxID=2606412 RepID=A0A5D9C824_9SPHN|nr:YbaK/EbsC family protein [Sphingomonas montanisoli]TZG27546.1 YbaK/EbsC family protein [Sphingomonas montanisoli]